MSRWPTWCQTGCCLCDGAPHPEQQALVRRARAEARRMTLREAVRESMLFEGEQEPGWTLRWATVGTLDAGGAPSGAEYECRLRGFWRIRMASQRARRRMARRLGLRPVMWREVAP